MKEDVEKSKESGFRKAGEGVAHYFRVSPQLQSSKN
jgi:hypothetical protein